MTIQNAPPGLDYDRDKKFSKVLCSFWIGIGLETTGYGFSFIFYAECDLNWNMDSHLICYLTFKSFIVVRV